MIELRNITLSLGGTPVLRDCSLTVPAGGSAALTGPSGCGKTTLLRIIAGLQKPDAGSVRAEGPVSYVFQEPRLFPWLTAAQNIELVAPGGAEAWLAKAEMPDAAGKYPGELSGGMRQRLNIVRALAYGGGVLLLDEPFKGLDTSLRKEITALIAREREGKTLLLVTHDEADLELAETVYHYRDGKFIVDTAPKR